MPFLYSFYHPCRTSYRYAIVWDIFSNHGIGSNHAMLTDLYIAYNHSVDSNVRTLSNGYFLTSLYNSLINHWNIYVAVLMITISYVHIWRKEYICIATVFVANSGLLSILLFMNSEQQIMVSMYL